MAKTLTGVVASNKGDKTIVVTVTTRKTHPLYKKQYTFSKKFMAHDEANEANEGDRVVIVETKPLSARKRFALQKVLEKAQIRHTDTTDVEELLVPSSKSSAKDLKKPEAKS